MTNYELIKNMSVEELASYLDMYFYFDDAPYVKWWDKTYCKKCAPERGTDEQGVTHEFAYCEVYEDKCRYFDRQLDVCDIIKLWLETDESNPNSYLNTDPLEKESKVRKDNILAQHKLNAMCTTITAEEYSDKDYMGENFLGQSNIQSN